MESTVAVGVPGIGKCGRNHTLSDVVVVGLQVMGVPYTTTTRRLVPERFLQDGT